MFQQAVLASLQLVSEEKKGQRGGDEQGRGSNLEEIAHGKHTFFSSEWTMKQLQNGEWVGNE